MGTGQADGQNCESGTAAGTADAFYPEHIIES